MADIEAKSWLPAIQRDWHDPESRRVILQQVFHTELLRRTQPNVVTAIEVQVSNAALSRQEANLAIYMEVIRSIRRGQIRGVDETDIDLQEDALTQTSSPTDALDKIGSFLAYVKIAA